MQQEHIPLLGHTRRGSSPITIIYSWWGTVLLTLLLLCGGVMQGVALPLWLVSFGSSLGGPYVIVLLSSLFYILLFGPMYLALRFLPTLPVSSPSFRKYYLQYILIGVFDAANGLLVVYVANPNRVPPVLSAILGSMTIIFAMIFTPLLVKAKRNISYTHVLPVLGVAAVLSGTVVSLIPEFIALSAHKEKFAGGSDAAIYTLLFIISLAPGVLYNILQEQVLAERTAEIEASPALLSPWQPYLDQIAVLFWGCLFQLLTTVLCFWVDLIPHFGYSKDMHDFLHGLTSAISCIFGGEHCHASAFYLGIIFNLGYSFSYLASIALNKESTNYATISSTMGAPLTAAFFLVFPSVLPPGSHNPPLWSVLPALFLAVFGTLVWKFWENDSYKPILDFLCCKNGSSASSKHTHVAYTTTKGSTNADMIE